MRAAAAKLVVPTANLRAIGLQLLALLMPVRSPARWRPSRRKGTRLVTSTPRRPGSAGPRKEKAPVLSRG